jgi:hypothetical protein
MDSVSLHPPKKKNSSEKSANIKCSCIARLELKKKLTSDSLDLDKNGQFANFTSDVWL